MMVMDVANATFDEESIKVGSAPYTTVGDDNTTASAALTISTGASNARRTDLDRRKPVYESAMYWDLSIWAFRFPFW